MRRESSGLLVQAMWPRMTFKVLQTRRHAVNLACRYRPFLPPQMGPSLPTVGTLCFSTPALASITSRRFQGVSAGMSHIPASTVHSAVDLKTE